MRSASSARAAPSSSPCEQRELEAGTSLGGRVPQVAPDRRRLLEPLDLPGGLRRGEHTQLERLGERGAVAANTGGGRRLRRALGGGTRVAARERDPPCGEQCVHLVHPRRARERPLDEPRRRLRLVRDDHARQTGERRDERLQVARRLAVATASSNAPRASAHSPRER